jgi:DNA-binding NtrC family response regulator
MTHPTSNSARLHDEPEGLDEPSPASPRAMSHEVLIVEDERRLREMLHASIVEMGLHPTTVASGEAALKLLSHRQVAVAVIDLHLPGMNGLELCERLHQQKPDIQMIILTGFGDLDAAKRAIRLQVVDFLTKPCRMDDLEHALSRARLRWFSRWASETPAESPKPAAAETPPVAAPAANVSAGARSQVSVEEMERELILQALARHHGNRQAAADELRISVRKLYYRIQQYQKQGFLQAE